MPGDFFDTSALAKHYHTEPGTAVVEAVWQDSSRELFISRLSLLEMFSVFSSKVRAGAISPADLDTLRKRFLADLTKTKRLTGIRLLVAHYKRRAIASPTRPAPPPAHTGLASTRRRA